MRGKGNLSGPFYSRSGITPACAGKRVRQHRRAGGKRDHPRVCGEKGSRYREIIRSMGSPPRVRGKDAVLFYMADPVGITPACAGKSRFQSRPRPVAGDHPRVCGEKSKEVAEYASKAGSPPRVRGKVEPFKGSMYQSRITPACAGKRTSPAGRRTVSWDHPRVCGEKHRPLPDISVLSGSPPRVRGKDCGHLYFLPPYGITPACAGKRLKRSHSIGHFSCILCLFHSVLHRASASGGSRAGPCAPPCLPAQNAVPV